MVRREAAGSTEEVYFSPPIVLAASETQEIRIDEGGKERVIDGRVVIGARRMTIGTKERILSGLGIQDEAGKVCVEAFGFYDSLDLPGLVIASKVLEVGIQSKPGFVATSEEALAAYYLTQDKTNENIFGILGSTIQEYPGVKDDRYPDRHPLVNRALVPFSGQKISVVDIAVAARELRVPINLSSLRKAHEKELITLDGWTQALHR